MAMGVRDLRVKPISSGEGGSLIFELPTSTRASVTGEYKMFLSSGGALIFDNGSTQTTIGAAGSGGTPTWETIFAADATFTITPDTTFTIAGNRSTATDVVTITNAAGGSGSCLQITNSGSGNDVDGTSNTWSVSKAGAASVLTLTLTGTTITSTADNIAWSLKDASATALVIGSSGSTAILTIDTTDATPLAKFGNGISLTDGNATFISTSNTATNVLVTNNTITTFGAAASSAGAVCIRSTSLTTGSLLQLQLSDTNNAGGFYLNCRESVGGTNDFTIGENGVLVMAGTAASDSLTVTAGDVVLSDGSITMTDADNAVSFSLTNNTATSSNVVLITSSGVATGVGANSFVNITQSGLTTGTALTVIAAAATTSVAVVDIQTLGLTSGTALRVAGTTATFTTGGKLIELDTVAAVAGNLLTATTTGAYTGTGMVLITAGAATTGILLSLVSTTGMTSGSLIRATTSTTGAIATNGAISFSASGAHTGTIGFVHISDVTASGIAMDITANALTTGSALLITSSGTVTSSGEGVVNIVASGLTTGDALKIDLTEGTLTTGHYINCYDDTGTASVFSVGENGVILYSDFTEVVTATNVITTAESGSVFFLSSATEFVSTLPAPQAGLHFTFIVSAAPSGASYTIVSASGTDNIHGVAVSAADAGGSVDTTAGTAADTITFVDGQALKGDMVDLFCDGTSWYARGLCSDEDAITFTAS